MRIVLFTICAIITIVLILVLNIPLSVSGSKTPRFGAFLSPQHGFWQNAEPADEDFNATLHFSNLRGKVQVYFDDRLVPHVYAEDENDAYFVQGYLHAKFRLWQMEFQTYAAAGRLSEIMGEKSGGSNFLKIDRFFRRLGMVYGAEQSLKKMEADPITKNETDAYTAGVNAYISALKTNHIPFEYKLLNYRPEKWTNLKTQLFLKYMSFDLAGGDNDFEMTNAKNIFSATDIELLYPTTSDSLDPIIPKGTIFQQATVVAHKPSAADSVYFHSTDTTETPLIIKPNKNNGSNNWVVAGSKTKSGAPILCNDPHLGLNLPSLWYEMQISTPTFNAYGVSFPGAPSIVIGFNDSCAWGVTNAGRDVKDYYEISFRDTSMQEYMYNGDWRRTTFRNEVIKVKGQQDVTERIAMTAFGPVMFDKNYSNVLKDGKYYALRWKAHDASNELLTFNKLNHARNYVDYIKAITTFQTPGQNFVFATKTGNIAIRQQGQFPAKWKRQGDFLMPGTDTGYLWQGFIPSRENPSIINPARGFLSSANQLATDATYPYYLAGQLEIYRGIIINRKLSHMSDITIANMQRLQTDNYNVFAEMAKPVFLKYLDQTKLTEDELRYLDKFKNWNLRSDINEEGPTVFKLWWDNFAQTVFRDEFAQTSLPLKWPDESTLLEGLLKDSTYKFIDDVSTPAIESVNDIVLKAFKSAYSDMKIADADNKLAWGKFKDTGIRHLLKLPSMSQLHLPIGGGTNIINATSGDHGPSWRMIVQLTEDTEAYGVYPGGQSGNPGSKYYDQFVDSWVNGKYFPLLFVTAANARTNSKMKWKMTFSKA
ncbi:penicillin acylase family protein [Segetibacter aerophilus]|uniref:Beta-lactam antibiotic acylase n=1 Tax=Segetibacter aerophilus TaxID=670293 RepID=A0A512BA86_9BACT|nr:penicillin acylase family protein [Segetibacter aerophilus]GEO08870.1 beta-lactam antibiotic acylase [Segetibacter aerophilus]